MNWDQIEGKWKEVKGRAKVTWGRLTHKDLQVVRGKRDQLIGKIQQVYGLAKEVAAEQVDEFGRKLAHRGFRLIRKATARKSSAASPKSGTKSAKRKVLAKR